MKRPSDIYASARSKQTVLEKFPRAKCVEEGDVRIFYIETQPGTRIAAGFSEAASWNQAAYLITLAKRANENS